MTAILRRETAKSIAGGLVGATVPGLISFRVADAFVVHAMREVVVGLLPAIFMNALMSALIPAVMTLRRTASLRHVREHGFLSLADLTAMVLSLAVVATFVTMGLIHLAAVAFSLYGLAEPGTMLLRAVQATLVAAVVTPLTITLLSARTEHA